LLEEGSARSNTFRRIVGEIGRSTGIVYVEDGFCAFGHLNGCLLPFLASTRSDRYLRIIISPGTVRVTHDQRIALIAHELQHAVEVLQHPEVVDVPSMDAMYRRLGTPLAGQPGYETSAARAAEGAVLAELSVKHPARSVHISADLSVRARFALLM
jgi:hypothetical protein